jgi:hypothetical protein
MFSDDVVALFEAGLEEDEREEVRRGLSDMGAVEVAKCFGVDEQLAEGYVVAAEALDQCSYTVFADARWRAREARRIVERHVSS